MDRAQNHHRPEAFRRIKGYRGMSALHRALRSIPDSVDTGIIVAETINHEPLPPMILHIARDIASNFSRQYELTCYHELAVFKAYRKTAVEET